jgi:hypothetical protein
LAALVGAKILIINRRLLSAREPPSPAECRLKTARSIIGSPDEFRQKAFDSSSAAQTSPRVLDSRDDYINQQHSRLPQRENFAIRCCRGFHPDAKQWATRIWVKQKFCDFF